jgi:hypothetical protein
VRTSTLALAILGPALALSALGLACGKPAGTIVLTTGPETDVLTRAPAPTRLVVDAYETDGGRTRLADTPLPASTIDLGEQPKDGIFTLRVEGSDDKGVLRAAGGTLLVQAGALQDRRLPVFFQRTGELARMPGTLGDAREAPLASVVAGRYALLTAGADASLAAKTQLYDLLSLGSLPSPPTFDVVPRSVAPIGTGVLLVHDAGAKVFDLSTSQSDDVPVPSGGTFDEVAGGPTVVAPDGVAYIVGAARGTGAPSKKVLRVEAGKGSSFLSLSEARLGAATAWVPGRGLLVCGGAATGPGCELFAPGTTAAVPLPYPADPTRGAAAAALDGTMVILVGGADTSADAGGAPRPTRRVDTSCTASCQATPWGKGLPVLLSPIEAHAVRGGALFVAGDAPGGQSAAYLVTDSATDPVPLRVPRRGARTVRSPTGSVLVVGGANQVEAFEP